jgi:NADH dehydrogenase [ubiquinone] 1 alpha subcomplex assembly factor 5
VSLILFDDVLRRLRRDRSVSMAGDDFLRARAFDDCLDRIAAVRRPFRSAFLVGRGLPSWRTVLAEIAPEIILADSIDALPAEPRSIDLCLCIGELETANDLATTAFTLRHLLAPGGLLIGAIIGGNSLPRLRAAMLAADRLSGNAAPRIHPMIDGPSLAALLGSVGLADPVIDVDRVEVAYPALDRLVADLRAMGCTNILADRSRVPLTRHGLAAARAAFLGGADQAVERFELLHFAAWAPADELKAI